MLCIFCVPPPPFHCHTWFRLVIIPAVSPPVNSFSNRSSWFNFIVFSSSFELHKIWSKMNDISQERSARVYSNSFRIQYIKHYVSPLCNVVQIYNSKIYCRRNFPEIFVKHQCALMLTTLLNIAHNAFRLNNFCEKKIFTFIFLQTVHIVIIRTQRIHRKTS